jgi:hypothetical protein
MDSGPGQLQGKERGRTAPWTAPLSFFYSYRAPISPAAFSTFAASFLTAGVKFYIALFLKNDKLNKF